MRTEEQVFETPEQAHQALTEAGYLTDQVTATTVYLAGKLHKPLLLEGPAGSGKTELSYAVIRSHDDGFDWNVVDGSFGYGYRGLPLNGFGFCVSTSVKSICA